MENSTEKIPFKLKSFLKTKESISRYSFLTAQKTATNNVMNVMKMTVANEFVMWAGSKDGLMHVRKNTKVIRQKT